MRARALAGAALGAAAALLAGCASGRSGAGAAGPPPAGAIVLVQRRGAMAPDRAELAAADSQAVSLLAGDTLHVVSWRRIVALDVERLGPGHDVAPREVVGEAKLRALRNVSRFPQGVPAGALGPGGALAALGVVAVDSSLAAPPAPSPEWSADSLADLAQPAAARFQDQRVAIAEGYSRVGPDYPGMGEPWVSFGSLARKVVDPANPVLLYYATINGSPTLVGVGFVTTTRGSDPATGAPGWPAAWHEHTGGLLLEDPEGDAPRPGGGVERDDARVWVMHLWTGLRNPEGVFHPDNWVLPFARLAIRVDVPPAPGHDAGRAAGLTVAGGDAYLLAQLANADVITEPGSRTAARVAQARTAAEAVLRGRATVGAAQLDALATVWRALRTQLHEWYGDRVLPALDESHATGTPARR